MQSVTTGTTNLASQVIAAILIEEMGLSTQAVWLREQNKTIPNDNGLYISVGLVSSQTVNNITEIQEITIAPAVTPSPYEVNLVQQQEAIQIDILSSAQSNLALMRNWEVIAALQSIYSQQMQEQYCFKIFRIPRSFVDTSSAEGGSMLQRYSITINAFVWYRKQKLLGTYYDDFTTGYYTDRNGALTEEFQFEINSTTPPPLGD